MYLSYAVLVYHIGIQVDALCWWRGVHCHWVCGQEQRSSLPWCQGGAQLQCQPPAGRGVPSGGAAVKEETSNCECPPTYTPSLWYASQQLHMGTVHLWTLCTVEQVKGCWESKVDRWSQWKGPLCSLTRMACPSNKVYCIDKLLIAFKLCNCNA